MRTQNTRARAHARARAGTHQIVEGIAAGLEQAPARCVEPSQWGVDAAKSGDAHVVSLDGGAAWVATAWIDAPLACVRTLRIHPAHAVARAFVQAYGVSMT